MGNPTRKSPARPGIGNAVTVQSSCGVLALVDGALLGALLPVVLGGVALAGHEVARELGHDVGVLDVRGVRLLEALLVLGGDGGHDVLVLGDGGGLALLVGLTLGHVSTRVEQLESVLLVKNRGEVALLHRLVEVQHAAAVDAARPRDRRLGDGAVGVGNARREDARGHGAGDLRDEGAAALLDGGDRPRRLAGLRGQREAGRGAEGEDDGLHCVEWI
mmetsp:Transcript_28361/g.95489  ORF Transcript_28361/g.95489 Transcript_28361/m.95489 type:complete len:218 (-) Transcript_28361:45-698(-)